MAEELLRKEMGDRIEISSAGLEPGVLNPHVIEVLAEEGIDISQKQTQSVFDLFKQNKTYNFVITVCDETSGERCPIFPGRVQRLHWSFPDPSVFAGSKTEIIEQTKAVRDLIARKIKEFAEHLNNLLS